MSAEGAEDYVALWVVVAGEACIIAPSEDATGFVTLWVVVGASVARLTLKPS